MKMEQFVELELAGVTGVLGKSCPNATLS
jgi:hypothetical protein